MVFRIGRSRAQHSYPTARTTAMFPLARNFASGPKDETDITEAGTLVPWSAIDSVQAWDATTTYPLGAIVSADGTTWISLQAANLNNNPSASPLFWEQNTVVPITPLSSAVIVIQGVLSVESASVAEEELSLVILINGVEVLVPVALEVTIPASGETVVPFLAEVVLAPSAVGVRFDVSIQLTAENDDTLSLSPDASTIEVREMQAATG
jgi:hypothetical protein